MKKEEYAIQIASTINKQLGNNPIVWSWGVSKRVATTFNEMPTLKIKVNGFLHKGWVLISYNEGGDYYIVSYTNNRMREVLEKDKEVYFDELISVIDNKVERKKEETDEEYRAKVNNAEYDL